MFVGNKFESFANSKRYKTLSVLKSTFSCLRALLIQKDTKLDYLHLNSSTSLRALLIQKDTKRRHNKEKIQARMRALLIQKDTKHTKSVMQKYLCLRALLIQKDTKLPVLFSPVFRV